MKIGSRRGYPIANITDGVKVTVPSGITFTTSNAGKQWSMQKNPKGDVWRFEVRPGDESPVDIGTGKERAEFFKTDSLMVQGTEYWLAFSFSLDFDATVVGSTHFTFGQLHTAPEAGDDAGLSPVFDESLSVTAQGHLIRTRTSNAVPTTVASVVVTTHSFSYLPPRHGWVNMVINIKVDPAGAGILKVWRNGTQVVNYAGAIGYAGPNNYWKWGIYSGANPNPLIVKFANMEGPTTSSLLARVATPLTIVES